MKRSLLFLSLFFAFVSLEAATNVVLQETFESGSIPAGWTQEYVSLPVTLGFDTAAFSWSVEQADSGLMYPSGAHSGTARAFARNNSGNEMRFVTRLVTPVMNLQGVFNPQLIFSHAEMAKSGLSDTLKVYYKSGSNDYWHEIPTAVYARESVWKTDTILLSNKGAAYQIAFEVTENMGRGVVLDDIIVQATPTCQNVNIASTLVHAYDAYVWWDANGAYNLFQVMLSESEITDFDNIGSDVSIIEVYNQGHQFTNLTPETNYYVYVRSDCDDTESGFTDWIGGTFKTLKVAYLPFAEDFNSAISFTGASAFGMPEGWSYGSSKENGQHGPFVVKNEAATHNLHYSEDSTAFLVFSDSLLAEPLALAAGGYVYAATPEIVAESLQGLEISFSATAYDKISIGSDVYDASLVVGVMTDPADFRTFTPIDTVHIETSYQFKRFSVVLNNYTGTGKYVALASNTNVRNFVSVDNFSMSMPDVFVPNHVSLSGVNANGFTVSADTYGADSWNIVVANVFSRTGDIPSSNILFSQSGITGNSVVVNMTDGTLEGQIVTVYAQSVRGGVASAWSFPVTVRVPSKMPLLEDLQTFSIGFETTNGQLLLSTLNNEVRNAPQVQGSSAVFYPVTSIDADINNFPKLSSSAPNYSGSAHAVLMGIDSWFVLPEVQNNIRDIKLVFRFATLSGVAGRFAVGVMTDPYDLSTFEQIAAFSTQETEYRRGLVSFDAYAGAGKYIAVRSLNAGVASKGSVNLLDEMVVSLLGTCREASNVQIEAHSDYADVSWNGGGMTQWIVAYSTNAHFAAYEHRDTINTPSYRFSNLESLTTYYFTVEAMCNGEGIGLDGVRYDFTTPRGLPFSETFASSLPSDWSTASGLASSVFSGGRMNTSSYGGWSMTSSDSRVFAPQQGYAASINIWGTSANYWLLSPVLNVDVVGGDGLELSFDVSVSPYYSSSQGGDDDKFIVAVSEDGGNTWSRSNATVWSNDGQGDYVFNDLYWGSSRTYVLDFTKYVGKTIQFAFYGESTVSNEDNYVVIDNVTLRVSDAACGGVSNVRALTLSSSEARVTWALGGVNPYPAIVQLSKSSTFNSFERIDTIQGTSIQYDNLSAMSQYYVRVKQDCNNDVNWHNASFMTACEAVTPNEFGTFTFDEPATIACWQAGFTNPAEDGTLPGRSSGSAYGAVLQIEKSSTGENASDGAYAISPEILVGDTIGRYQVVFDACTYSRSELNVGRIQVGIVSDPSDAGNTFEKMAEIYPEYASDAQHMMTYVVSFEDYTGDLDGNFGHYIMFLSEAGADSTNYIYIDNISIEPAGSCKQVLDLSVQSAFTEGGVITWSGDAEQYEVAVSSEFMRADTASAQMFIKRRIVSESPYTITGLQATSTYYVYVRALCGSGDTARWSAARELQTAIGVPFYENFSATSFEDGTWERYSGLFNTDSILTSNLSSSTSWNTTNSMDGITGMSGYALKQNIYGSSVKYWVMSPVLDLTRNEGEVELSFLAAMRPYNNNSYNLLPGEDDKLWVVVSKDGGTTWKQSDVYAVDLATLSKQAKRITFDLTNYNGYSIRFAFYDESTSGPSMTETDNDIFIDSVALISQSAVCIGVRNLTTTLVDNNSVDVNWSIVGTPEEVKVELSADQDFASIISEVTTENSSCRFDDLDYDSQYYVRVVQVDCSKSAVTSFRTPYSIPYTEAFNASARPSTWTTLQGSVASAFAGTKPMAVTNANGWQISTSSNGLSANHLLGEMFRTSIQTQQWLVSPDVILAADDEDNVGIVFDVALTKHNSADAPTAQELGSQAFYLLLSTDGGATWSESNSWKFAEEDDAYIRLSDIPATGRRLQIDLSGYKNTAVRVAFYKECSSQVADNDLHIANVQLRVIGEECAEPTNLVYSDLTFNTVMLSWDGQDNKPTVIEYATLSDFSDAKQDTVAAGLQKQMTGLQSGATYNVRVRQICSEKSESGYSNVVSFSTPITLPYNESFSTSLGGWEGYVCDTPFVKIFAGDNTLTPNARWSYDDKHNAILGEPHIYCQAAVRYVYWLISPNIDMSSAAVGDNVTLQLDLAYTARYSAATAPTAANAPKGKFHVLVSTDGGDTWAANDCYTWSAEADAMYQIVGIPNGLGKTYSIDFSKYAGQNIKVAFAFEAQTANVVISVNNLSVAVRESMCMGVEKVVISDIDTAAVVTITPYDNDNQWEVAYGLSGTEVTEMPKVLTDSVVCSIGGLQLSSSLSNVSYDVYARSICGEGDTSVWSGPYKLTTPIGLPYFSEMNSVTGFTRHYGIPDSVFAGAQLQNTTSGWMVTDNGTNLGGNHVYCTRDATLNYWLVTREINLMPQTGENGIYLSFDLALSSQIGSSTSPATTDGHKFYVVVSKDGGETWLKDDAIVWGEDTATVDYFYKDIPAGVGTRYHLDLRQYAGKKIKIAFIEGAAPLGAAVIHLGNIELAEYAVPCFGVDGVSLKVGSTTTTVTIRSDEDAITTWEYALGSVGFTPSDLNAVSVSNKVFTLTDLQGLTSYDIYVRSVCDEENRSSWKGPYSFTTFDIPLSLPYSDDLHWTSFKSEWTQYSGTLDNLTSGSSAWSVGRSSEAFGSSHVNINTYGEDHRHLLVSPNISLENVRSAELSFDIAITHYASSSATTNQHGHEFYVLVSNDGTWSFDRGWRWADDDEPSDYSYDEISNTGDRFVLDLSDYLGEVVQFGFYAVSTMSSSSGEDVDLHLQNLVVDSVSSAASCMPIRSMKVNNATYSSANVTFRATGIQSAREIEYVVLSQYDMFNPSMAIKSDTNVVTITGLSSSTSYSVYTRLMCADSTWTEWSGPFALRTAECTPITGITVDEVSFNGATVTLNTSSSSAAAGYQAVLVEHGNAPDMSQVVTRVVNQITMVKPLSVRTEYDVYARKICQVGDTSEWYGPFSLMSPYGFPFFESMNWTEIDDQWKVYKSDSYNSLNSLTEPSSSYYSYGWFAGQEGKCFEESHAYATSYGTSYGSGYNYMLVTPNIDLSSVSSGTALSLSFELAFSNSSGDPFTSTSSNLDGRYFYVVVSTGGNWNINNGWKWSSDAVTDFQFAELSPEGTLYELDMSAYAGQQVKIGFFNACSSSASYTTGYTHLRNVSVDVSGAAGVCAGINNVTASNITLNSADITFQYKDTELLDMLKNAEVEVSDDKNFSNIVFTTSLKTVATCSVTGLQPSTTYYVRVRQECPDGGTSSWSHAVSFRTALGIRYHEDFSAALTDWTYSDTQFGSTRTVINATSSGSWSRITPASNDGVFTEPYIRINIWSTRVGWAITPAIDLTPNVGQGLLFAFDFAWYKYSYSAPYNTPPAPADDDRFIVAVSLDDGHTWLRSNAFVWDCQNTGDYDLTQCNEVPQRFFLDFSRFAGQTIKVGFYGESTVSNGDNFMAVSNVDFNAVTQISYSDSICEFSDYANYGFEYMAEELSIGDNQFTYISQNFDTITTLNINVMKTLTDTVSGSVCEGDVFTGYGFNMQATRSDYYRRVVEGSNGCDSIVVLDLSVYQKARVDIEQEVCAGTSITINGRTYYNNAVAVDTLTIDETGCDSIITYYLSFSDTAHLHTVINRIACLGDYYDDGLFRQNAAGTYTKTTTSAMGCDSTVTLNLYVTDALGMMYDTVHILDLPYSFMGEELIPVGSEGGDYTFSFDSIATCSTAELHVFVNSETALHNLSSSELSISPNPALIGQQIIIGADLNSMGDITLSVYDAVGRLVFRTSDKSGILPGLSTAGYYTIRLSSAKGDKHAKLLVK